MIHNCDRKHFLSTTCESSNCGCMIVIMSHAIREQRLSDRGVNQAVKRIAFK